MPGLTHSLLRHQLGLGLHPKWVATRSSTGLKTCWLMVIVDWQSSWILIELSNTFHASVHFCTHSSVSLVVHTSLAKLVHYKIAMWLTGILLKLMWVACMLVVVIDWRGLLHAEHLVDTVGSVRLRAVEMRWLRGLRIWVWLGGLVHWLDQTLLVGVKSIVVLQMNVIWIGRVRWWPILLRNLVLLKTISSHFVGVHFLTTNYTRVRGHYNLIGQILWPKLLFVIFNLFLVSWSYLVFLQGGLSTKLKLTSLCSWSALECTSSSANKWSACQVLNNLSCFLKSD